MAGKSIIIEVGGSLDAGVAIGEPDLVHRVVPFVVGEGIPAGPINYAERRRRGIDLP